MIPEIFERLVFVVSSFTTINKFLIFALTLLTIRQSFWRRRKHHTWLKAFACPPGAIPVIGNILEFAGPPISTCKMINERAYLN
jgi:hypothetical protein